MKTYILFLLYIIFILHPSKNNAQWVQQTNGLSNGWGLAKAIDACDSNTIVFSADESIFFSSDGGNNWLTTTINDSEYMSIWDISIIDSLHIWGAASNGKIFATTDGGENWDIQFYDTTLTNFINYIEMFDLQNGIAMGDGLTSDQHPAVFLKTKDGGNTWISMNDSAFGGYAWGVWSKLDFITVDTGYFCATGIETLKLFKTINGGAQWKYANYQGGLQILKFYNKDIGLLKETNYYPEYSCNFKRTIDGGNTWEFIELEYDGWGNDIEFLPNDPSQIWYVDGHNGYHFLYSNDTGKTWTNQTMPVENSAGRDIVFTDDKHGWILCDDGKLFYTNNNGGIVTEVEKEKPNTLPTEFGLKQNYPNPFNPITIINFSIPVANENIHPPVQLKVYDVLGKEIATLINEIKPSGSYEVKFNADNLSSGIYYYQLKTKNFVETKKMVLLK